MSRLLLFLIVIFPLAGQAQFELVGDAIEIAPSTFQLTEDKLNENGSVWHKLRHDFTTNFRVAGEFYFGDFEDGADGIVFVIQDNCIGSGGLGLGIGYLNFPGRSLGLEFDTYQNAGGQVNDPVEDHIAISRDGNVDHLNNLIGPVQMHPTQTNVEDGSWYPYEITYDATTQVLDVAFANEQRLTYNIDIVGDILDGSPFAYWGFTSATGGFSAANSVSILEYESFTISDFAKCSSDPAIEVEIPYDDIVYTLSPQDGVSTENNGQTILLDPQSTTEYTLTLPDICLGTVEFDFTVNVSNVDAEISVIPNGCDNYDLGIVVNESTTPYAYLWSTASTEPTLDNVPPGDYSVIVTDGNFCTQELVIDLLDSGVNVTTQQSNVNCHGEMTGSIIADVNGGTPPYDYLWSSGEVTSDISGLAAGDYSLIVTDNIGCQASALVTITEPESTIGLTLMQVGGLPCEGQANTQASVDVIGGTPPYDIMWSNGDEGPIATNLLQGEYQVTVIDSNNCPATDAITIEYSNAIVSQITGTEVICPGEAEGIITILVESGISPFQYSIDGGESFQDDNQFADLTAGEYAIAIQDGEGCIANETFVISESDQIILSAGTDQVIELGDSVSSDAVIESGSTPSSISWTPVNGLSCHECLNPTLSPMETTLYTLSVEDSNGCSKTDSVLITVTNGLDIFIPNVMTPTSGDENSMFKLFGDDQLASILQMTIYDRWGNLIFEGSDLDPLTYQGWDGTFVGVPVEVGVYVYVFKVEFANGQVSFYTGDVLVVR